MYFSTYHWLPLVNGWTSYMPASYWFLKTYMAQLPAEGPLQMLRDCTGLRWILVHGVLGPQAQAQWSRAWDALSGVRLRESFHDAGRRPDRIYEVLLGSRPGCASRLTQRDVTIEGHPLVRLTAMSGQLSIVGLDAAPRFGRRSQITVTIENSGTEIWPSTTISRSRVVLLSVSWTRLSDGTETRFEQILLPQDVAPGERVDFTAWLDHPRVAGDHRLTVSASQGVRSGGPAITWERELNVVGPQR